MRVHATAVDLVTSGAAALAVLCTDRQDALRVAVRRVIALLSNLLRTTRDHVTRAMYATTR